MRRPSLAHRSHLFGSVTRLLLLFILIAAACSQSAPQTANPPQTSASTTITMPDTIHVVALGDSLAYGAGDETGEGIAGRLEDELLARGVERVQTVNLGVNGAQTGDVLSRLKQERVRKALANADAVVLSIGANDLFRSGQSRDEILRAPFEIAERILGRIHTIVTEIHAINPEARILLLGGYNPVPRHQ